MSQKTISSNDYIEDALVIKCNDNFDELYTHTDNSSGVHGVTGDVVGTTDTQTLTNKTLTTSGNNLDGVSGNLVGTTDTQTLSNKTLASPTFSGSSLSALDMGSNKVTSVTDPTSNQDAATKYYVDQQAFSTSLPTQTGHAGEFVKTDGSSAEWAAITESDITFDQQLDDIKDLSPTDGGFIVGDGSNFIVESGATARTSLSLDNVPNEDATDMDNWDQKGAASRQVPAWDGSKYAPIDGPVWDIVATASPSGATVVGFTLDFTTYKKFYLLATDVNTGEHQESANVKFSSGTYAINSAAWEKISTNGWSVNSSSTEDNIELTGASSSDPLISAGSDRSMIEMEIKRQTTATEGVWLTWKLLNHMHGDNPITVIYGDAIFEDAGINYIQYTHDNGGANIYGNFTLYGLR